MTKPKIKAPPPPVDLDADLSPRYRNVRNAIDLWTEACDQGTAVNIDRLCRTVSRDTDYVRKVLAAGGLTTTRQMFTWNPELWENTGRREALGRALAAHDYYPGWDYGPGDAAFGEAVRAWARGDGPLPGGDTT